MRICNRSFKVCERTPHHYEIMDWLLEIGTDINATDEVSIIAYSSRIILIDVFSTLRAFLHLIDRLEIQLFLTRLLNLT